MCIWNKAPAIWFPRLGRVRCEAEIAAQRPGSTHIGTGDAEPVARWIESSMSAKRTRARGDWELSAKKRSDTEGAGKSRRSKKSQASQRGGRGQRQSDLGRALRSVYDDTLRETVPDDFLSLLGKLS